MQSRASAPLPHASDGNRVAHRHKVFLPVRMTSGQRDLRVHLINVSATGALVHHASPPAREDAVVLDLGDAAPRGRVVWVDGPRFGIAFDGRLDQRTIDVLFAG